MENILKYYEFSDFFEDKSKTFEGAISYTILNSQHFLVFEKNEHQYHLYVAKYANQKVIGVSTPEILELLVENYDKSIPEHRIALRQYIQ